MKVSELEALERQAEQARTSLAKLQGEQASAEKQLKVLAEECQEAFECSLQQLPKMIQREEAAVVEQVGKLTAELAEVQEAVRAAQEE